MKFVVHSCTHLHRNTIESRPIADKDPVFCLCQKDSEVLPPRSEDQYHRKKLSFRHEGFPAVALRKTNKPIREYTH